MIPQTPRTILIVEDDPAALATYGRLLSRLGHEVRLRPGCDAVLADEEGLRLADLIILDQQMPGMRGLDLLDLLTRRGAWSSRGAGAPRDN
jgi:CheY-like chemotaxis protein